MAGTISKMINAIIEQRSKGNPTIKVTTRTKLILKGFNPDNFNASSPDDPAIIETLQAVATAFGVTLNHLFISGERFTPIATAFSVKNNADAVADDLKRQLSGPPIKLLIYFASPQCDPKALSGAMQKAFEGASVFGCTTAGEIVTGKMLKGSVVAMAMGSDTIADAAIAIVDRISSEDRVAQAFVQFAQYYGTPMISMDPQKYVGIVLIDGLRGAEEKIMDSMGDLTNVTFIGASAGDDRKFRLTHVFANGKAYTDAAVLVLLKPAVKFDFLKAQNFCSTGKKLVPTSVDEAKRTVHEFNGKPAVQAYAEALSVDMDKITDRFRTNPLGLMIGKEPYVRSPQQVRNNSMVFYCNVKNGMELEVLQSTDIVSDTLRALDAKKAELKNISGIINFHCVLRTLELDAKGQTEAYGKIFADIPTIGFSTYGEEYIGHINQTSTMLLFR